jgi:hypothetical protein
MSGPTQLRIRPLPAWRPPNVACQAAQEEQPMLQRHALANGLKLLVKAVGCKAGVYELLWLFEDGDDGRTVLDCYPATGRYRTLDGRWGRAKDCWDALDVATRVYLSY